MDGDEDFEGVMLDLSSIHDLLPVESIAREKINLTKIAIQRMKNRFQTEPMIKLKDKLSFVIGIVNVFVTATLLSGYPQRYPLFYTLKALLLLTLRFLLYRKKKFHYFLFDFCYFANILNLIYLYLSPSLILFQICFSFSVGPLLFAILAWRNSLVLHSIDYTTSLFIHLSPAILLYILRWKAPIPMIADSSPSFIDLTIIPLVPYLVWQVSYLIITEGIFKDKIESRNLLTSFRHFTSEDTKGAIPKMVRRFKSKQARLLAFCGYQFGYTFITMLPSLLCWYYEYVHITLIALLSLVSVWNGANFYFEVFLAKYKSHLEAAVASAQKSPASAQKSKKK